MTAPRAVTVAANQPDPNSSTACYRVGDGRTVRSGRRVAVEQGAPPPDYPAVVAAVGRAVGDLAGAVAPAVPAGRG